MSVYQQARDFARAHVLPTSAECDATASFPDEAFRQMAAHGWFALLIPEEFGGQGGGLPEHAEACLAFAEANPSAALCYMMHNVALRCALTHGDEAQKRRICKDVLDGKFMALAYSEFGSGTHFYNPQIEAAFGPEGVTINGAKSMVTSAGKASTYMIITRAEEEGKLDNWALPLSTPGVSFQSSAWNGLGMRSNISCPMLLDDVKLGFDARIGAAGSGQEQLLGVVSIFFVTGLAAIYSGVCATLGELAAGHAKSRTYPDGSALSHIETVQNHLSAIYVRAAAARSLTLEAARAEADALPKILAARIFSAESAIECGRLAMRVGGGKAYNKALPIERFLRDAYAGQVMAPGVDVLNLWLGKILTDQPIP
ncbi:acyl-CoA dehydrogenase family protein [Neomegalonema sp.]|uniref:acyl-CoA dehydrogenase family protein n=1 Tax=Neomegalonema sp. TaxID=2039713 RepID=UPI002613F877|nr:acyl-CoA dehydrogenase family protein [Neomegalonema sp.]MDD2867840.1 acyl-CoA/acyl-ACP dehydrogenase [Neomegalonema sp.]